MKIKISTVIILIVVFIVVASEYFFFLGPEINTIVLLMMLLMGLIICMAKTRREMGIIKTQLNFCGGYIFMSCIIFSTILMYTIIAFPRQNLLYTLRGFGYYYYVLIAILLLCYMIRKKKDSNIYLLLEICTVIWYMLVLAQKIVYDINGTIIIDSYFEYFCGGFVPLRNGMIRISLRWFGNLMLIYNFYKFYVLGNKKKLIYFGIFILGMYEVIMIQQTRAYTLCNLICIFTIILLKRNTKKEFFRKLFLFIIAILIILETGIVSNFIDSFSSSGTFANSTLARSYAIKYYWEYFLNHPIFGMGFASTTFYSSVVKGLSGKASIDDVGMLGQFVRLGVFVIPIYILLLIRFFRILGMMKKYGQFKEDYIWYSSFFIQLLITSVSLSMMDKQRIMLYPLSIALFEFQYLRIKEKVTKENQS